MKRTRLGNKSPIRVDLLCARHHAKYALSTHHPCNSLVEGPSPHFYEGKLRLREIKHPVQGDKAKEMNRPLQTPTGSLDRQEDGQAGGPEPNQRLSPDPADPKSTPFCHSGQKAMCQRQRGKGGNSCCWEQNPRSLGRQGWGWVPSWAPLSASLVALGKQRVLSELNQERTQPGAC